MLIQGPVGGIGSGKVAQCVLLTMKDGVFVDTAERREVLNSSQETRLCDGLRLGAATLINGRYVLSAEAL